jgi:bifunctional non-homologous end joining protein LigD
MARLSTYWAKRDFGITAEPRGKTGGKIKKLRFVVQRHDATRLHYDLRLELDGVYKSWAVTKTPSPDPAVKRLAVEVEDHPLQYGTFEGIIPKGQYGGGTVQLWDSGHWRPQTATPLKDLQKGHLKIVLEGARMKGGWALIRLRDKESQRPGKKTRHNWLLIKEKDDEAQPGKEDALTKEITSIKTGRTLDEIADSNPKVWNSNRAETKSETMPEKKSSRRESASSRKPVIQGSKKKIRPRKHA